MVWLTENGVGSFLSEVEIVDLDCGFPLLFLFDPTLWEQLLFWFYSLISEHPVRHIIYKIQGI
mgnify:FL=1